MVLQQMAGAFQNTNNFYKFLIFLKLFIFSSLFLYPFSAFSENTKLLQAAQQLLKQGLSIQAYDLLTPYEDELSGNNEYDYLYGVAALDSGEPRKAIFIFQRAVMTDPEFAGARMELARSYFEIGELEQAKSEFTILKSMGPPKLTEETIDKYLSAIENRSLKNVRGLHGYIMFGVGDDSNANNATTADSFIGFQLSEDSRKSASNILLAKSGFIYNHPVDYYRSYYVSGNIYQRSNSDVSFTNSINIDFTTGIHQKLLSGNIIGTSVQYYSTDVDGAFNNSGLMLTGQYGLKFTANDQLLSYLRLGGIRFSDEYSSKDINQGVMGLSWIHVLNSYKRPSINTSLLYGVDKVIENDSPYNRDFYGLSVSSVVAMSHKLNLFSSVGLVVSDYDGSFFNIDESRSDSQMIASVGSTWYPNKVWAVQPILRYVKNDSNLTLYEYDKIEFIITLRSDF